jgi:hypothetical protein
MASSNLLSAEALGVFNRFALLVLGGVFLILGVLGVAVREGVSIGSIACTAAGLCGCAHEWAIRKGKPARLLNVLANSLFAVLMLMGVIDAMAEGRSGTAILLLATALVLFVMPGVVALRR